MADWVKGMVSAFADDRFDNAMNRQSAIDLKRMDVIFRILVMIFNNVCKVSKYVY